MNKDFFENFLKYNPNTGEFVWKVNKKGPAKIGMKAGSIHSRGYISIGINNKYYLAHRIALIISGFDLSKNQQVDHINGNRIDNRIENLRIATHAQNCQNSFIRKDNRSGFKGVGYDQRRKKWRARIRLGGKQTLIGYFKSPEEAHKAYCDAAKKFFGEFSKT